MLNNSRLVRNGPTKKMSRWKWELLCLKQESNPHLFYSRPACWSLHHLGCLMWLLYLYLLVYAVPYLRDQCRLLHSSAWNCNSAYNYLHMCSYLRYTHKVGSTTIYIVASTGSWSLERVSWRWWNWKILCLEQESNPHLLNCGPVCCSLHHIGSLMSLSYARFPVYAARCLRGQFT